MLLKFCKQIPRVCSANFSQIMNSNHLPLEKYNMCSQLFINMTPTLKTPQEAAKQIIASNIKDEDILVGSLVYIREALALANIRDVQSDPLFIDYFRKIAENFDGMSPLGVCYALPLMAKFNDTLIKNSIKDHLAKFDKTNDFNSTNIKVLGKLLTSVLNFARMPRLLNFFIASASSDIDSVKILLKYNYYLKEGEPKAYINPTHLSLLADNIKNITSKKVAYLIHYLLEIKNDEIIAKIWPQLDVANFALDDMTKLINKGILYKTNSKDLNDMIIEMVQRQADHNIDNTRGISMILKNAYMPSSTVTETFAMRIRNIIETNNIDSLSDEVIILEFLKYRNSLNQALVEFISKNFFNITNTGVLTHLIKVITISSNKNIFEAKLDILSYFNIEEYAKKDPLRVLLLVQNTRYQSYVPMLMAEVKKMAPCIIQNLDKYSKILYQINQKEIIPIIKDAFTKYVHSETQEKKYMLLAILAYPKEALESNNTALLKDLLKFPTNISHIKLPKTREYFDLLMMFDLQGIEHGSNLVDYIFLGTTYEHKFVGNIKEKLIRHINQSSVVFNQYTSYCALLNILDFEDVSLYKKYSSQLLNLLTETLFNPIIHITSFNTLLSLKYFRSSANKIAEKAKIYLPKIIESIENNSPEKSEVSRILVYLQYHNALTIEDKINVTSRCLSNIPHTTIYGKFSLNNLILQMNASSSAVRQVNIKELCNIEQYRYNMLLYILYKVGDSINYELLTQMSANLIESIDSIERAKTTLFKLYSIPSYQNVSFKCLKVLEPYILSIQNSKQYERIILKLGYYFPEYFNRMIEKFLSNPTVFSFHEIIYLVSACNFSSPSLNRFIQFIESNSHMKGSPAIDDLMKRIRILPHLAAMEPLHKWIRTHFAKALLENLSIPEVYICARYVLKMPLTALQISIGVNNISRTNFLNQETSPDFPSIIKMFKIDITSTYINGIVIPYYCKSLNIAFIPLQDKRNSSYSVMHKAKLKAILYDNLNIKYKLVDDISLLKSKDILMEELKKLGLNPINPTNNRAPHDTSSSTSKTTELKQNAQIINLQTGNTPAHKNQETNIKRSHLLD